MTLYEFTQCLSELAIALGAVADGDKFERRAALYFKNRFEKFDLSIVKAAFSRAAEQEDVARLPSIAKLMEYARIEKANLPRASFEPIPCFECSGAGVLYARKDGYQTVFKCHRCDNCTYNYPEWSKYYEKDGYVLERVIDDELMIVGLAVLGKDSIVWKKTSPELQQKALEIMKNPKKSSSKNLFNFGQSLTEKENRETERLRMQSIAQDKRREEQSFEDSKRAMINNFNAGRSI